MNYVRLEGFEPPTLGSVDRCSNPLSYSRKVKNQILAEVGTRRTS